MPKIIQLETCCGCCSTEIGSKIIAWLIIVSGVIYLILGGIFLCLGLSGIYIMDDFEDVIIDEDIDKELYQEAKEYFVLAVCSLILDYGSVLISVILAVYLLKGISMKNMRYVRNWLIWAIINEIVYFGSTILSLIHSLVTHHFSSFFFHISGIGLWIYCFLVVYSYYRQEKQSSPSASSKPC